MPSPTRRQVLRTSATALVTAGFAGCLGGGGTDGEPAPDGTTAAERTPRRTTAEWTSEGPTAGKSTDDGDSEPTTDGDSESTTDGDAASFAVPESTVKPVADARVGVADPVAREAVAYESIMGSGGVLAPDGKQFVVAAAQSATDSSPDAAGPPSYEAFELVVGDDSFPAVGVEQRTKGALTTALAGRGSVRYDDPYADSGGENRVGWLAFEVPSPLDADAPEIRCRYGGESGAWRLPDEVAASFGRQAPRFELRTFSARVLDGREVELSLTAENVAGVAGEFLAAVYWPTAIADDDESHLVRDAVAPNDRVEWSKTVDAEYTEPRSGEVTASVEGCVSGTTTVSLSPKTTRTSH